MDRMERAKKECHIVVYCSLLPSVPHSPPLHYIGFLPAADVVLAEVLDIEALLHLVEAPQPLALRGASLALPALATPEETQGGQKDEDTK